jgi:hypothetical protein
MYDNYPPGMDPDFECSACGVPMCYHMVAGAWQPCALIDRLAWWWDASGRRRQLAGRAPKSSIGYRRGLDALLGARDAIAAMAARYLPRRIRQDQGGDELPF